MIGRVLGHFEIREKIGQGGMGVVYRAHDRNLNRPVAVKVLSEDVADESRRRRFQQEAQMASALNHPHILTVFETGSVDGQQYIVTEFIDGYTARDWVENHVPSLSQKLDLLIGIADALATAHAAGVLHRDIKPQNILVAKSGHAKLVDFGLAKLLDDSSDPNAHTETLKDGLTKTGVVLGTVTYMSPEQAAGRPVDVRSDIFSFGAVAYELISNRRAFEGSSMIEILHNIANHAPAPLDAPVELRLIVEKALEKHPSDRYQSMREVVIDLKRFQRSKSSEIVPLPHTPRKTKMWAMVGALLAAAAVLGAMMWRSRQNIQWENPLAGARIERITDFEGQEADAAISPDGNFVAFLSDRGGSVNAWITRLGSGDFVNLTQNRFFTVILPGIRSVGFSPDGAQVWLRVEHHSGGRVDPQGTSLISVMGSGLRRLLEVGVEPHWSPDGRKLVYHDPRAGDPIFVADQNGSDPKRIFSEQPGDHCHYLTWSRDGRYIYFVRGLPLERTDIWRIPSTGGEPERITRHNSLVEHPVLLNDHTMLYIADAEDGSGPGLYGVDLRNGVSQRVSIGVEQYLSLSASADGRRLAASVANPTGELWTVPILDRVATDADATQFRMATARATGPRFGRNGTFYLSKGGASSLWRLRDGVATELWKAADGGLIGPPAVSPDGKLLCFTIRKQGRGQLYLMTAEGTNATRLANGDALDVRAAPSWSPDGKWLAVTAYEGDKRRLFKVPVENGASVPVVSGVVTNPEWAPDGRWILYRERQGPSFIVKAVTPEGSPATIPNLTIGVTATDGYRFLPGGGVIAALLGEAPVQNFWLINLDTGIRRQITDFKQGLRIQSFDISADGKQIIFDRWREDSDIVLIERAKH